MNGEIAEVHEDTNYINSKRHDLEVLLQREINVVFEVYDFNRYVDLNFYFYFIE